MKKQKYLIQEGALKKNRVLSVNFVCRFLDLSKMSSDFVRVLTAILWFVNYKTELAAHTMQCNVVRSGYDVSVFACVRWPKLRRALYGER